MKFNWLTIINILSVILMFNAGFMLLGVPVSLYYDQQDWQPILWAALITLGIGGLPWLLTRKANKELRNREGYLW